MRLYEKQGFWSFFNPLELVRIITRNWSLVRQLSWRQVDAPHRGSMLGFGWSFINPLLTFGVYAFVFIAVFKGRYGVVESETNVDYALGLLLGLTMLQLFQEVLLTAPYAVLQSPNYVKKVVFPLEILPVTILGAALIRFSICLALVLVSVAVFGPGLHVTAWWLVPITFCVALLAVGVGWFLAAVGVFLRDIAPLTQALSLLLMFMSGVFYSLKQIPKEFHFLQYNPILIVVESTRDAILWARVPDLGWLSYLAGASCLVAIAGFGCFRALRGAFSEVL
ncbi:MAG: ABC transporter permease [Opitutaceae bacterium]|nr:ABC transporter permease [Opitutaceae bacterium]